MVIKNTYCEQNYSIEMLSMCLITIEGLDPTSVIIRQCVSIVIYILIGGEHQSSPVPGVVQPQRMTKLMGSHQQQIHS